MPRCHKSQIHTAHGGTTSHPCARCPACATRRAFQRTVDKSRANREASLWLQSRDSGRCEFPMKAKWEKRWAGIASVAPSVGNQHLDTSHDSYVQRSGSTASQSPDLWDRSGALHALSAGGDVCLGFPSRVVGCWIPSSACLHFWSLFGHFSKPFSCTFTQLHVSSIPQPFYYHNTPLNVVLPTTSLLRTWWVAQRRAMATRARTGGRTAGCENWTVRSANPGSSPKLHRTPRVSVAASVSLGHPALASTAA